MDVYVEAVVDAAAVFFAIAGAVLLTAADIILCVGNQVGAVAVLVLDDGKGIRAAEVPAVIGAIAVGHVLIRVCMALASAQSGGSMILTNVSVTSVLVGAVCFVPVCA